MRVILQGRSENQLRRRAATRLGVGEAELESLTLRRGRSLRDGSPLVKVAFWAAGSPKMAGETASFGPKEALESLLGHMGVDAEVARRIEGDTVVLEISVEDEDLLIGEEGRTLEAQQHLIARMAVLSGWEEELLVDVGSYRRERDVELKDAATEWIEDVRETGERFRTMALYASERKVVHRKALEIGGVRTFSVGSGTLKRIVIDPE